MALTMTEVFQKILDNANIGKAVTDVGPGFALSIPLLMTLSLVSDVSVLPADRLREIRTDLTAAQAELSTRKAALCNILGEQGEPCQSQSTRERAEEGWVKGRRRIAQLSVTADAYREQARALAKAGKPVGDKEKAEGEAGLRQLELLAAQKELSEESAARLATLNNRETDARSLEFNMVSFANQISIVIAFSVVLGVLVSQITHLLLVDLLFAKSRAIKLIAKLPITIAQLLSKQDDELVKNYYRYMEGAINMVLPVLLTGHVFPRYAAQKLALSVSAVPLAIASWGVAVLLILVGFITYKSFISKRQSLADDVANGRIVLIPRVS